MKTISLKLADTFDAELAAVARQRGISKSALIRDAVETFLRTNGREEPSSALSLAEDLAGCLAGPGDLSSNPDYLREFGR